MLHKFKAKLDGFSENPCEPKEYKRITFRFDENRLDENSTFGYLTVMTKDAKLAEKLKVCHILISIEEAEQ